MVQHRFVDLDGQAGSRGLLEFGWCAALAVDPRLKGLADSLVYGDARPVRGILFDKVAGRNWNLGWHQDTKIAVQAAKPDVPGFSAWSVKEGVVHTLPPVEILESCVALRIHLDPCPADNGPLQCIPGSHRLGLRDYPSEEEIATAVTLTAEVGDLMSSPFKVRGMKQGDQVSLPVSELNDWAFFAESGPVGMFTEKIVRGG